MTLYALVRNRFRPDRIEGRILRKPLDKPGLGGRRFRRRFVSLEESNRRKHLPERYAQTCLILVKTV